MTNSPIYSSYVPSYSSNLNSTYNSGYAGYYNSSYTGGYPNRPDGTAFMLTLLYYADQTENGKKPTGDAESSAAFFKKLLGDDPGAAYKLKSAFNPLSYTNLTNGYTGTAQNYLYNSINTYDSSQAGGFSGFGLHASINTYGSTAQSYLKNALGQYTGGSTTAFSGFGFHALSDSYAGTAQSYIRNALEASPNADTENFSGFGFKNLLNSYSRNL